MSILRERLRFIETPPTSDVSEDDSSEDEEKNVHGFRV